LPSAQSGEGGGAGLGQCTTKRLLLGRACAIPHPRQLRFGPFQVPRGGQLDD
jgi:hypothetical protein